MHFHTYPYKVLNKSNEEVAEFIEADAKAFRMRCVAFEDDTNGTLVNIYLHHSLAHGKREPDYHFNYWGDYSKPQEVHMSRTETNK